MKANKVYILIFIIGLCWASCSDILISTIKNDIPHIYLEYLRMINNIALFGVSAFFLYKNIKKQQHQLQISEAQYRSLFESNPNPMWLFHKEKHHFVAVNDAMIAKYQYSRNEFSAMSIWDIRPKEDYGLLLEVLKETHQDTCEMGSWRHIKKSGEFFWVSIVTHDIFFNQQPCMMVMATDITEVILKEEKLRKAYQKEKDLNSQLAENYNMILSQHDILQDIAWSNSHDLRRPLCSVMGLTTLLEDASTEAEIKEYLPLLAICTRELDEIIQKTSMKIDQLEDNYTDSLTVTS
jgi:PAS domain S-box-containing protein